MTTTTFALVRDQMVAAIQAIVPVRHSQVRFSRERGEVDFTSWSESAPDACLRRFEIRDLFAYEMPLQVFNADLAILRTDALVRVAYPMANLGRFGVKNQDDFEAFMESDQIQIFRAVGDGGQQNFAAGQNASWFRGAALMRGERVLINEMTFQVEFHRSVTS